MKKKRKRAFALPAVILCAAALIAAAVLLTLSRDPEIPFLAPDTELGDRLQPVWNDAIIDTEKTTAELTLHAPIRQETVFCTDRPWENAADGFHIVPYDGGYRLYYAARSASGGLRICCAQSVDGLLWEKPELGLVSYDGSTANNILLDESAGITGGFFAFRDANPEASLQETYKAIAVNDEGDLLRYVSADGLVWKEKGALGRKNSAAVQEMSTLHSAFWDEARQLYFCYYIAEEDGLQHIMVTVSQNFRRWSAPQSVVCGDDASRFSLQTANILPYYRAQTMLVGLPLRVTGVDSTLLRTNFGSDAAAQALTDAVFLFSTDGVCFDLTPEAWLTPGPQTGINWRFGDCLIAGGLVETDALHTDAGQDRELSLYVAESLPSGAGTALVRYTMRIDGFASYHAPYNTAKVVTRPVTFDGSRMTLNFSTSTDGYVYVRILNENGEPFADIPYTAEDGSVYAVPEYTSYKMIGDRVDREVVFNGDLSTLRGRNVILEFYLSDAELYSFRFDDEPYQTDTVWQPEVIELREHAAFHYTDTEPVIDIGTDRQVFWDDYIVDTTRTDAVPAAHASVRREELFRTDLPWEGDNCDFYVIFDDVDGEGQSYHRMYYLGWDSSDFADIRVCYAYSYDGISWVKPELGLHSFTDPVTGEVYPQTNIVLYTEEEIFDNFFVMKDTRPGVPDSQLYKAICQGRTDQLGYSSYGLWAWVSPDGLHWTKTHRVLPQLEEWFGSFDSVNSLVWDETTQQFFTYFRVRESQLIDGIDFVDFRKIYGATGDDFEPFDTETLFALDYGADAPLFEMYTNNILKYYRAPQISIGFPTRFSRNHIWAKNYEYLSDPRTRLENFNAGQLTRTLSMTDAMFMTSRDGYLWNRQNEAFLTPGPEYEANWIYGNCYPAYGLIETSATVPGADNEISTYLFEGKFYHEPSVFYRYALRLDGFRSYKGSYAPQTLTTKPLTFTGSELQVNFRTSAAGSLQINLLDETGQPLEGYRSGTLLGDDTDRRVVFEKDLAPLNGVPVIMEFVLSDAEVYSFRFQ